MKSIRWASIDTYVYKRKERPRRPTAPQPFSSMVKTNFQTKPFSLGTLSPILTKRKTPLSCYSVLSRFPLDRKMKKKNSLNFFSCFFFTFSFSAFSLFWFRNANPFFIFFLLFYSPRWRVIHSDTGMAPWQKHASGELSTSSATGLRRFAGILGASGLIWCSLTQSCQNRR